MQPAAITLTVLCALAIVFALIALIVARRRWPERYEYWVAPWSIDPGEDPEPQYHRTGTPTAVDHE